MVLLLHAHMKVFYHVGKRCPSSSEQLPGDHKKKCSELSKEQLQVLECMCTTPPYSDCTSVKKLSEALNLEKSRVYRWVRKRRFKKKDNGKFGLIHVNSTIAPNYILSNISSQLIVCSIHLYQEVW